MECTDFVNYVKDLWIALYNSSYNHWTQRSLFLICKCKNNFFSSSWQWNNNLKKFKEASRKQSSLLHKIFYYIIITLHIKYHFSFCTKVYHLSFQMSHLFSVKHFQKFCYLKKNSILEPSSFFNICGIWNFLIIHCIQKLSVQVSCVLALLAVHESCQSDVLVILYLTYYHKS
jgi:hypothetical protein